jgi:cell division protein FtsQ
MKKLRTILPWVVLLAYITLAFTFVSGKRRAIMVDKITVNVSDKNNNNFVAERDIIKMLTDKNEHIVGANIDSLDLNHIETIINHHPSIKEANVFRSLNGELHIKVEQRNPILRVFNIYNESFYIDEDGYLMPISGKYAAHVLIANGNIKSNYHQHKNLNYAKANNDSVYQHNKTLFDLYTLANFITTDPFWRSQIEQVYVTNGRYELVPRLGRHIIKLGPVGNYQQKFRNLKALYEQGLPEAGWNNYKTINLEYKNQVVCTRVQ